MNDISTADRRVSLVVAAELLGVSTKTVRRWISAGVIPAERLGNKTIRIKVDDLNAAGRAITIPRAATSPSRVR